MPWKTAQKKAKQKKKVQLALLTLGLILGLILTSQIFKVGHTLFSPLNQDKRSYHWDGTFNLNLVLLTKPLSLLSYNPVEQTIKIIEVADETYLEVPGGFGSWRAGTIYKLGEAEQFPKGPKLLKDSFGNFFALPIDGFLRVNGLEDQSAKTLTATLRSNPLSFLSSLPKMTTDLSPIELARFYFGARAVRFDKVITYNLSDLGLLSDGNLADGTRILIGDSTKIDGLVTRNFTENKIVDEAATVAVFNATSEPGLAAKSAILISHIGGNVIIQSSMEEESKQTAVFGRGSPDTQKRLTQIFGNDCENEKKCAILGTSASSVQDFSRAQVNLILGSE